VPDPAESLVCIPMSRPTFLTPDPALEAAVQREGQKLFALMDGVGSPAALSKRGIYGRLMEWSMKDAAFKTQLFRFVDVLPSLTSSAEIVRHLREYLGDAAVELNPALKAGLAVSSLAPALVAGPVKNNVTRMAAQFVAGESAADLVKQVRRNAARGLATSIDLLGEAVVSEAEADVFLARNRDVLATVAAAIAQDPQPSFSDVGPRGVLPRLNLSVKVSALGPDIQPADLERSIDALKRRLRPILRHATEVGAFLNFDMESFRLKDLTLALFRSILEEAEFRESPAVGIALQAYLRDSARDLRDIVAWARHYTRPLGVRLVKGAYWDYESVVARQRNWPVPVWEKKAETDANYEALTLVLLENIDVIAPAFATHNVRSCAHAIAQADRLGVDPRAYEFQALFGMADELKTALVQGGHRVREYCPVGELLPGMAYLVRRLLENTSNEGFLRAKDTGEATREQLLRNPVGILAGAPAAPASTPAPGVFVNAAGIDFGRAGSDVPMRSALARVTDRLGARWPLVIGGKKIATAEFIRSVNPARPSQTIGHWARATVVEAEAAITAARAAQPAWARLTADQRGNVFERAAALMEARRHDLNALMILEAGKPWLEADADVSEAIDFCRFYAIEVRRLDEGSVTQAVPGERCVQRWMPRGVGAVIAPWNFPIAILCGMTAAAALAGNAVVMKPAEQTTIIAAAFMDVLAEAGLPPGVVNFSPGYGEDVGAFLVAHPGVDFIAFTGSRAVGLQIWAAAGQTHPGQANLKKVICEMGGKNALVIDTDADMDEAIPAVLASAFGFSGQKCSALSRLIVLAGVYEPFVARLIAACETLKMGDPALPGTVVGPVIDAAAREKITAAIERGKLEAKLAFQGLISPDLVASGGYFVPPTVFVDVPPDAVIAKDEIFGPVLAVIRARDLDHAIAIANASDYALTGGLFSRSPDALARAERELSAGNVYLNRGITGAVVERHPFGGFKMSGAGTKAGGRGYLENFLFPRVIVENVLRRGFTPPADE
jgi:RHH-type proline utilization regulon transcriptional repressor/proline dehydrogenase/delta 1-pyrroline-5-carboxylate dehydrogenase